jgi:hypothetical protein
VLLGVGLVVACALIFAVMATRSGRPVGVLALSRDVAAGQVLSAADLTTVDVAAGGAAAPGLVPAGQKHDWVGRTLTGPLPAGQLLSPANLGPAAWPPDGQAVVAVALQAGHLPAGVVVGSQVRVVLPASAPASSTGSSAGLASGPAGDRLRSYDASVVQVAGLPALGGGGGAAGDGPSRVAASTVGEGAVLSLLMRAQDAATVAANAGRDVSVILQTRGSGG